MSNNGWKTSILFLWTSWPHQSVCQCAGSIYSAQYGTASTTFVIILSWTCEIGWDRRNWKTELIWNRRMQSETCFKWPCLIWSNLSLNYHISKMQNWHLPPVDVFWYMVFFIPYSCSDTCTPSLLRIPLFGPSLNFKFSVMLWEITFGL